jgi:hypothetical protein
MAPVPVRPVSSPPLPARGPTAARIGVAVALLLVAGCAVAASPGPTATSVPATPPPSSSAAPETPTASTTGPLASLPTQTDTAWGRIWDELPASFPRYPGASPASTGRAPLSGEFTVAADPATVVSALRAALEAAGYQTVSLSSPLEDGSRTLESAGAAAGCRVQTTVGPLGGLTAIAVLFGSACPFR